MRSNLLETAIVLNCSVFKGLLGKQELQCCPCGQIPAGTTLSKGCSGSSMCQATGNSSTSGSATWQLSEWNTCSQPCGGGTAKRTLRYAQPQARMEFECFRQAIFKTCHDY